MEEWKGMRARVISTMLRRPLVIYRESPIFQYFSDDERSDAILIEDGRIQQIGAKALDDSYIEEIPQSFCCLSSSYMFRKCDQCSIDIQQCFLNPFADEVNEIKNAFSLLRESVMEVVGEINKGTTEIEIQNIISGKVVSKGFNLFYKPIIAGDNNMKNIWHRSSDYVPERVLYIEVSAMKGGLPCLYSETFLLKEDKQIMDDYSSFTNGIEYVKQNFVEGNYTKNFYVLEPLRNKKISLTVPLFPYQYFQYPGEDKLIHSMDTIVFDFWIIRDYYVLRKKIAAVAGTSKATIL